MPVFTFLPGQNESTIIHSVIGGLNTITCNSVLSRNDTLNGCVVSHGKPPTALCWAQLTLRVVPWLRHSLFTVAHHTKGKHRPWCTQHRVTPQWTSMVQEQFNHWSHCINCRDAKIKTWKPPHSPTHNHRKISIQNSSDGVFNSILERAFLLEYPILR